MIAATDGARLLESLRQLGSKYAEINDPVYLNAIPRLADLLPPDLTDHLARLRDRRSTAALLIRGMPLQVTAPTPTHWREWRPEDTLLHDFWLTLVCGQLGEIFSFTSLQEGSLVEDILPIEGLEDAQLGLSSLGGFDFHVDDPFDEDRCDFFGLIAMRNPDRTETMLAAIDDADLSGLDTEVLFEPRFLIQVDSEHLEGMGITDEVTVRRPVLNGSRSAPGLCLDWTYTDAVPGDTRAQAGLADLRSRMEAVMTTLALEPGDLLLVDNYRSVHGRRPFRPRYDGADRWLRHAMVTLDLGRSLARRSSAEDRRIGPLSLAAMQGSIGSRDT
ncbi:TauD/TfdA family dioxygenase [Actinomadura sp. DC4]|uniref:TauD/TfdA family dioxygenase n=1 Tax=Actinomadura sp. DC4 TaxID=3055069 RepID=UPI0025B1006F|nr:TauD/TfdA family dioxygenase [Actinomadura sp. DC4]MDN3358516.1 TauD/TfdA family dioxygenase [Actinomadura sp. DC4]